MYFMFPTLNRSVLICTCLGLPNEGPHLPVHLKKNPDLGLDTALSVNNVKQKCRNEVLN